MATLGPRADIAGTPSKATTQASLVNTYDFVAVLSAASLASSGYQKLPSGLILQWGSVSITAATGQVVLLPISFITAGHSVLATSQSANVYASAAFSGLAAITIASYAGGVATNSNVNWFCVGV